MKNRKPLHKMWMNLHQYGIADVELDYAFEFVDRK